MNTSIDTYIYIYILPIVYSNRISVVSTGVLWFSPLEISLGSPKLSQTGSLLSDEFLRSRSAKVSLGKAALQYIYVYIYTYIYMYIYIYTYMRVMKTPHPGNFWNYSPHVSLHVSVTDLHGYLIVERNQFSHLNYPTCSEGNSTLVQISLAPNW